MDFELNHCMLCPRKCCADRTKSTGFCGGGNTIRAAKACIHLWEEPCLSGNNGAGAIFFSGCNLRCCYCQNIKISTGNFGTELSIDKLSEIILNLQKENANVIDLVTGSHYTPWIVESLKQVKHELKIPVVWNCSGYESPEILEMLNGYIDIYMPDFKYIKPETAKKYSYAEDYVEVTKKAIAEMVHQVGNPVFKDSILQKGVIIRHLILPSHRKESIALLYWLSENFSKDSFLISLMGQYTPPENELSEKNLNRKLTTMEYQSVLNVAQELDFNGFSQELSSAKKEYTPNFNLEGIKNSHC